MSRLPRVFAPTTRRKSRYRSASEISSSRAIPTIVSGFGLPDDDIHAPNESYRLESLELGSRTARELLVSLADL